MNPKLILCLGFVLITGCRGIGTQKFTVLAPTQAVELESSSGTVLDVTCTHLKASPDYNLRENLSMLAPMPKRWKYDMTLRVERVVKGEFDERTLQIHWLREPTSEQRGLLGVSPAWPIGITNGMSLRIGFDAYSGNQMKNFKIMRQP